MRIYRSINWHESAEAPPYVSKIFHKTFLYLCPPFVPRLTEVMPYSVTHTVTDVDVTAANKDKENKISSTTVILRKVVLLADTYTTRTAYQDNSACMFSNQKYTLGIFFVYIGIH